MLTQIKKIKSLGVFDNYAATPELKAFDRFNIVYGENGSGKTTFSRFLSCLQAGEHSDYPHLEFHVDTQSGPLSHGQKYGRNVRVFNSDFVDANIGRFEGPLRHILILGEENRSVADEIKAEIRTRDDRTKRLQDITAAVAKLESDRGKIFSAIATIGPVGAAHALAQRCKALTLRSASSAVISRLATHPMIATWVEEGVGLHKTHASENCEFCSQPLPAARLQALADHFSVEDQQLKAEIDQERAWLSSVLEALGGFTFPDRLALYSELRPDYDAAVSDFASELEAVRQRLRVADAVLVDKLTRRTEAYDAKVETDAEALKAALASIADVMQRHDAKTKDFELEKYAARDVELVPLQRRSETARLTVHLV